MFTPSAFRMKDREAMSSFIKKNSFGILCSVVNQIPSATHLPLILAESSLGHDAEGKFPRLLGHFARANPHWKSLDGQEVLVIFHGPHAYISPSWYDELEAVPTWNYVAVHVRGICRLRQDEESLQKILFDTVKYYEPHSPLLNQVNEDFYQNMSQGVVGFEIEITSMEGKVKLSQNKSPKTIQNVIDALTRSGDAMDGATAAWMKAIQNTPQGE